MIDYGRIPIWMGLALACVGRRGPVPVDQGRAPRAARDASARLMGIAGSAGRCRHRHILEPCKRLLYLRRRCLHRTHHTGGSAVGRRSPHPNGRRPTNPGVLCCCDGRARGDRPSPIHGSADEARPHRRTALHAPRRRGLRARPRHAAPVAIHRARGRGQGRLRRRPRRCIPRAVSRGRHRARSREARQGAHEARTRAHGRRRRDRAGGRIDPDDRTGERGRGSDPEHLAGSDGAGPRLDVAHRRPLLRPEGARRCSASPTLR